MGNRGFGSTTNRQFQWAYTLLAVLLAVGVLFAARGRRGGDPDSIGELPLNSAGLFRTEVAVGEMTLAAITYAPDVETEDAALMATLVAVASSESASGTKTPLPTLAKAYALGTAEAIFEVGLDRDSSIDAASEILRLDPGADSKYVEFLERNALIAATSPLPFPYVSDGDGSGVNQSDADYYEEALTAEFREVCKERVVPDFKVCTRDALLDHPKYMRALIYVPESVALPIAHSGIQSVNQLVVSASVYVSCFFGDTSIVTLMEQRLMELDWPMPDAVLAMDLLFCQSAEAEELALEVLGGDQDMLDAARQTLSVVFSTATP